MNSNNFITLLLWSGLIILAGYQVLVNTVVRSDMSIFMPQIDDNQFALFTRDAANSPAARIWLLALEGASPGTLAEASKKFASALRDSGRFNSVLNGENILSDADEAFLIKYRYLLDPHINKQSFSVEKLKNELEERLNELASPMSPFVKKWLPSDPTGSYLRVAQNMAGQFSSPNYFNDVWVTEAQDRAFIIAETKVAGLDLDAQSSVKTYLTDLLPQITDDKNVKLAFSGSPNIAIQSRDKIRSESKRLSIIATVFMLGFLFWVYRSRKHVLLMVLPLAIAILFATAVVSFLFDGIHGITLAFGITVLGVAVDYPIHVLSHANKEKLLSHSIQRIWPTLRLGMITTILGYAAMAISDFPGLAQFGVFSIVGLFTAAYLTRSLFSGFNFKGVDTPRLFHVTGKLDIKANLFIVAVVSLLFILFLIGMLTTDDYWSEDLSELSPIPKRVIDEDRHLRQLLKVDQPRYFVTVEANDLEGVLIKQEILLPVLQRAIKEGELRAIQMAVQLLPSQQQQKSRKALLPDKKLINNNLNEALQELPFKSNIFKPFLIDIENTKSMPLLTYAKFQQSSGFASRLHGLLNQTDNRVSGLVRLIGIEEPNELAQRLQQASVEGVFFMDIKQSSSDLVSQFRQEALIRIFWAGGLMVLVLAIGLRNLNRMMRVSIPVVCAVLVASAVPLILGEKLNIFHLMSLLLVVGISLDYALFFSYPSEKIDNHQTLHALSVCAISTIVVFGLLASATIPVLLTIGLTVATGVFAAFVLSWTFSRNTSLSIFLST